MVQGYYTLEEGAKVLGLTTDRLSQMAQKREVRAFADRGSWRFRVQDIEEMARRMGQGSSPDLQLGDVQASAPAAPPPSPPAAEEDLFDFAPSSGDEFEISLDSPSTKPAPKKSGLSPSPRGGDDVDLGFELPKETPSTGAQPRKSGLSPSPKPGSDSDVKLVPEGSDVDFQITLADDSDVKVEGLGPASSKSKLKGGPEGAPSTPGGRKKSALGPAMDSGVRLVPMDEDDDLGILPPKTPADSDIRMEAPAASPTGSSSDEMFLTEDIDLDAELRQAEEAKRAQKSRSKIRPKTRTAPGDAPAPERKSKLSGLGQERKSKLSGLGQERKSQLGNRPPAAPAPGSDEFELIPGDEPPSQPAHSLEDDEVSLGDLDPVDLGDISSTSGINLHQPADSGINLEHAGQGSDDKIEFELGLDDVAATPRPGKAAVDDDSSSDFELSLDVESTPQPAAAGDDDSSEFELTLDDSGGLDLEEAPGAEGEAEQDIFETDFEVPVLDEESNSEAVALDEGDTDLESSDFDLSLSEEESGSQVVALDEEVEGAVEPAMEGEEVDELLAEDVEEPAFESAEFETGDVEAEEEEEEDYEAAPAAAAAPANWGVLPAILMVPTVLVMLVLGLMAFELVHGMWGYRQNYQPTGLVVEGISKMVGVELPPEKKK